MKNTQKITKAMKMVAAAKLRRAQQRLTQSRPYVQALEALVRQIAARYDAAEISGRDDLQRAFGVGELPLLRRPETVIRSEFLILTSDRGLCGGFNGNLLRRIEMRLKEEAKSPREVILTVVGRKGRDFFKARQIEPAKVLTGLYERFNREWVATLASEIADRYRQGAFDSFYLVYNGFKSVLSQEIRIEPLLPICRDGPDQLPPIDFIYEASPRDVLEGLLSRWFEGRIGAAILESIASEQGARMAAMDNATNNCRDMILKLTLNMNRLRQAVITKELMDIVNGAEAL